MTRSYFIDRDFTSNGLNVAINNLYIEGNFLKSHIFITHDGMIEQNWRKSEATQYAADYAKAMAAQPGLPEGYTMAVDGKNISLMRAYDENRPSEQVLAEDGAAIAKWFERAHELTIASIGMPVEHRHSGETLLAAKYAGHREAGRTQELR